MTENLSLHVDKIDFCDGTSFQCSPNDIIVFVGSNNCGKTTALNGIFNCITQNINNILVNQASCNKVGTKEGLENFVKKRGKVHVNNIDTYSLFFNRGNHNVSLNNLVQNWEHNVHQHITGQIFSHFLKTEERLTLTNKQNSRLDGDSLPGSPLQMIDYDDNLAKEISRLFAKIFFEDLVIDTFASNKISLRVGKKPSWTKQHDRQSNEYRDKLRSLPLLDNQGDGMKSVAGIILELWTAFQSMFFIDEPEAFLHPPQAKELAKILAAEKPNNRQLFIATHSSDFIKGLLEANTGNVHIIRIVRTDNSTQFKVLKNEDMQEILKDSWLRYSNALDAMFYEYTVLCESDADCRFYHAVMDSIKWGKRSRPEALFISCGGKSRFHKAIPYMKKLGVTPKVIADIDVVKGKKDGNHTKLIYKALGGDYTDISVDHGKVQNEINQSKLEKTIKKEGISILKTSKANFNSLITKCMTYGFFIPSVGELESWCRIKEHRSEDKSDGWLIKLFDKYPNLSKCTKLKGASAFIKNIFM